MQLFDAHCHLQDVRLRPFLDDALARGRAAGVCGMMCCGTSEKDWDDVYDLSIKHRGVHPSFGVHPWFVSERSGRWLERLEKMVSSTRSAVGEIGLDGVVDDAGMEEQAAVFIAQLRLANKYGRPVSIHCRKAFGVLLDILKKEGGLPCGGLVHSYSGSPEMAVELERLGCSVSFSGSLTRRGNKRARKVCAAVSPGRLLIETDCPDLLPEDAEGSINEPANLRFVLAALADVRGVTETQASELVYDNALRIFKGITD